MVNRSEMGSGSRMARESRELIGNETAMQMRGVFPFCPASSKAQMQVRATYPAPSVIDAASIRGPAGTNSSSA